MFQVILVLQLNGLDKMVQLDHFWSTKNDPVEPILAINSGSAYQQWS